MRLSIILLIFFLTACNETHHDQMTQNTESPLRFINGDDLTPSGLPFSNAVEADGWIFLSGALGTVAGKGLVERGIEAETRQTMENIRSLLKSEDLGMDRIVKCTVMLADISEWPAFNEVYKEFFTGAFPARSAFAASGLALDARVEVECIARR